MRHERLRTRTLGESILVTDGEQRAALAVVRSLGKAGYLPIVCSHDSRPLAGASRYAAATELVPNPLTDPRSYLDAVIRIVARRDVRVVVPVAEQSHLALLPERHRVPTAVIAAGSAESFRRVSSKDEVLRVAAQLSIAVPPQLEISTRETVPAELDASLFPGVLKPARSVHAGELFRVMYADDADSARQILRGLPATAFPILLQRRIIGHGTGIFVLIWDGELIATFAHRRLREQPPSGGASVYCEAIPVDHDLLERSRRLLSAFDYQGVAMVEYKRDASTGTPYIMEVNARFWGSLQLAIDAGVDFPRLLVECALGRRTREPGEYKQGVRLRSWWADVDHLLVRLRHSATTLALPPDAPSRLAVAARFLRWRPGDHMETFRVDDVGPFFTDTRRWFASRFGRRDGASNPGQEAGSR